MADTQTKAWLKSELVSALGFAEVDEIVSYITNTFSTHEEASSYFIELLGIPAKRAEDISTRLFSPAAAVAKSGDKEAAAATERDGVVSRSKLISHPKSRKKNKKAELLNDALIINCLRCGRIEFNGARRCVFCDTELHYECDAILTAQDGRQNLKELVRLSETTKERPREVEAEHVSKDENHVESDTQRSKGRHSITNALEPNNGQFLDTKIPRNEHLTRDAREIADEIQRKMSTVRSGKVSLGDSLSVASGIQVVVDDSYHLAFV